MRISSMSINKILFGVIGILFLAIFGVGIFALQNPSTVSDDTPMPIVSGIPSPQVTNTQPITPSKNPNEYTIKEVARHNSLSSCYTAINGSVYDLTPFINQHPGGQQAIESLCGIDGTVAFDNQHGGQRRPANELAGLEVGILVQ